MRTEIEKVSAGYCKQNETGKENVQQREKRKERDGVMTFPM